MKTILLSCAFLALSAVMYGQSVIVVQNDTSMHTYLTLNEAVAAAIDGDYIYVPGGTYHVGTLNIDKRLNLIGAGHHFGATQATGMTIINGDVHFIYGSDYSLMQGFYLNNNLSLGDNQSRALSNIMISRCNLNTLWMSYNSTLMKHDVTTNVLIKECIIRGIADMAYNDNQHVFDHCIFNQTLQAVTSGVEVLNSLFLSESVQLLYSVNSGVFRNCVFNLKNRGNLVYSNAAAPSSFYNCLFGCPMANQTDQDNYFFNCYTFNGDVKMLYQSVTATTYKDEDDYHFKADSIVGMPLDLAKLGLYGGTEPYKEMAIPMNPHIESILVPSQTDGQGRLNIQVKVAAQDN